MCPSDVPAISKSIGFEAPRKDRARNYDHISPFLSLDVSPGFLGYMMGKIWMSFFFACLLSLLGYLGAWIASLPWIASIRCTRA